MATVIQTKKKESAFSGVAKAAASAVAQQLREQKDGDYYLKNLKLLGALQRTNDTAGVGEVATAEAVKPKAEPTVAPAGYMAPEAGDWVQDVAKAQGVDMSQPAFIANQPGFKKDAARVAAREVTPRLDEEQKFASQGGKNWYRRKLTEGAQFETFDYGATNMPPVGGGEQERVGRILEKTPSMETSAPVVPAAMPQGSPKKEISGKGTEPATHWMTDAEREEFYNNPDSTKDPLGRYRKDRRIKDRADENYHYKYAGSYGEVGRIMAQDELRKQTELLRKAGMFTENKEL